MAANLRVRGTQAYQPYREVEPVPPYSRINPQQSRDEYPQQQSEQRVDKTDPVRRRFRTMRKLIDELKEMTGLARVDYSTAEMELNNLGFLIAEAELVDQLLELKISPQEIGELLQQLRSRSISSTLGAGHNLSESDNFFPVFVAGLSEYNLCFQNLQVKIDQKSDKIIEKVETSGRFISEKNRLRLDFSDATPAEETNTLQLDISILVAVSEVDDDRRRVILYQRPDKSYALYADKQIDLSI
ncbi:MAG: hypothetical protein U9Q61_00150 [Thermodesulfobacteriota bacterium]|nr:hypothetical protein [Thermodesulfobacteriota bacterium]